MWQKIILSIVGLILAGGGITGYQIIKNDTNIPNDFDNIPHIVESVIDGDTIKISKTESSSWRDRVKVRLLSIDTPEKGECYYKEAKEYLTNLIEKKEILLEKDISGIDKYDRFLRYVVLPSIDPKEDSILINERLIRKGYAVYIASPPNNRYNDLFATAQRKAKDEKLGIWGECGQSEKSEKETNKLREQNDAVPPSPECTIKGNISEKGYGKIFLVEGCANYNRVKIDTRKGEQYFCSEKEAISAGFRKVENCP